MCGTLIYDVIPKAVFKLSIRSFYYFERDVFHDMENFNDIRGEVSEREGKKFLVLRHS